MYSNREVVVSLMDQTCDIDCTAMNIVTCAILDVA
jgi:hypothetical protein